MNLNHEADVEAKTWTSLKSEKIEFSNNEMGHHHIPLEIIQWVKDLLIMFEWNIIQQVKEITHTHSLCLNETIFWNLVAKAQKTLLYA